jgi:cysteine synthase B
MQYLGTIDSELTREHTAVLFACDRMESYISYVKERRPDIFGLEGNERLWHDLSEEEIAEAPLLTVRQLRALSRDTSPLVIDTRSTVAYSLEHIPGALNYPLEDLQRILRTSIPFPRERAIVFVCQHGVFTRPLAAHLSQRGFEAFSLEGGYRAWLNTPEPVLSAANE